MNPNSRRRHTPGRLSMLLVLLALAVSAVAADGEEQSSTSEDRQSIAITIYNNNLGLVKDVRRVTVPKGVIDLKFEEVAAKIDPTSVHIRSLDHPRQLEVLEQNFEFDLINPAKLMEKYLGQTVELVTKEDEREVTHTARLIGNQDGYVYEMEGKIAIDPPGRVVLPELPQGLISKPTLMWMLRNDRDEHTVEASYLTGGIGWKSNYVVVLSRDDKTMGISGWVTIDNRSGATYTDAAIKLVAGDVHRVVPERRRQRVAVMDALEAEEQFAEEAFFEYHLYTLQRPSTIRDNQTKQISLLEADGVSVIKKYIYTPSTAYWFSQMRGPDTRSKIGVFLVVDNAKQNNLGKPLPKGIVRVYKEDKDDALQFIGEDAIDHTPEGETIRIKMGDAFDIVGERTQTSWRVLSSGHLYESSYKIEIRNHKDEDVVVSVVESIPGDWTITESSHEFEKETSNRVRFDLPVAAKNSTVLTYAVRVKY